MYNATTCEPTNSSHYELKYFPSCIGIKVAGRKALVGLRKRHNNRERLGTLNRGLADYCEFRVAPETAQLAPPFKSLEPRTIEQTARSTRSQAKNRHSLMCPGIIRIIKSHWVSDIVGAPTRPRPLVSTSPISPLL